MKIIYLIIAFLCIIIGSIGILVPILPTTPFLLVASFCFAKGSTKFHTWFTQTKLYQNHLSGYLKNRSMTLKTKLSILLPVSALLLFSIVLIPYWHVRLLIAAIIVFKYYYFFFRIKTIK